MVVRSVRCSNVTIVPSTSNRSTILQIEAGSDRVDVVERHDDRATGTDMLRAAVHRRSDVTEYGDWLDDGEPVAPVELDARPITSDDVDADPTRPKPLGHDRCSGTEHQHLMVTSNPTEQLVERGHSVDTTSEDRTPQIERRAR